MLLEVAESAFIYAFHMSQLPCFLPGFLRYCFFSTHCGRRPQELSTLSGLLISAFLSELLSLNPYSAQQSELLKAEMRGSCFSTLSPCFAICCLVLVLQCGLGTDARSLFSFHSFSYIAEPQWVPEELRHSRTLCLLF